MGWTKTPPIKTGWHYWRKDKTCKWITIDLFKNWQNIGGEWWDSPVPEPMDSQKIKLELAGDVDNFVGNTLSRKSKGQLKFYIEQWKPRGE